MSGAEATCKIYAELADKLMADNALANPETMRHCVEKMRGLFGERVEFAMLVPPFLESSGTFDEVMGVCGKYWTGYKFERGSCTVKRGEDAANATAIVDADIYAIDENKKEIEGTRKGLGQVTHYFTTNDDGKIIKWTQEFDADHINLCRAKLDGLKAKWHESWVLAVPMFSQDMFATTTLAKPEPHNVDQPFKRDSEKGDDVYGAVSGWESAVADAPARHDSHDWETAAGVWHDQEIHFYEEADPIQPVSPTLLTSKAIKGKKVSAKNTSDPLPPAPLEGVWPKIVITMEVSDFDVWYEGFTMHADSKKGSWGLELPITRTEIVDDEQTLVLRGTNNPNRVMVVMTDVRSHKTEALIANPNKTRRVVENVQYILGEKPETKAIKSAVDPPGPDVPSSDLAVWMQVANFDVWVKGFWEHATSTTGSWGFSVPITRREFMDESRTEVFRGLVGGKYGGPNHVGITCFGVVNAKTGVLSDPTFVELTKVLGEMADTKVMKIMVDAF